MSTTTGGRKAWLNGLLFALTCLTVFAAGLIWSWGFLRTDPLPDLGLPALVARLFGETGLYPLAGLYMAALMTILLGHELGHYLTCRRYHVQATLPYFIPGLPFLGTFGAFIRMKSHVAFKHEIFDIGANGPLTGFLLTVPVLVAGLLFSRVVPMPASAQGAIAFGDPLLITILSGFLVGPVPQGSMLNSHPLVAAGWVGLLVTAVNLFPIGKLDGGHISYAVFGRRAQGLSRLMMGLMALMGLFFHVSWLIFAVVILVIDHRSKTRLAHPPVFDEAAPLDAKRKVRSLAIAVIFVLSFIPEPVKGMGLLDLIKNPAGWLR